MPGSECCDVKCVLRGQQAAHHEGSLNNVRNNTIVLGESKTTMDDLKMPSVRRAI